MYTTKTQVKQAFWAHLEGINPGLYAKRKVNKSQNEQVTDIRVYFCDFVDHLHKDGQISDKLAYSITL